MLEVIHGLSVRAEPLGNSCSPYVAVSLFRLTLIFLSSDVWWLATFMSFSLSLSFFFEVIPINHRDCYGCVQ